MTQSNKDGVPSLEGKPKLTKLPVGYAIGYEGYALPYATTQSKGLVEVMVDGEYGLDMDFDQAVS